MNASMGLGSFRLFCRLYKMLRSSNYAVEWNSTRLCFCNVVDDSEVGNDGKIGRENRKDCIEQ